MYFGDDCSDIRVVGPCAVRPCANGVCLAQSEDVSEGGYTCVCNAGFTLNGAGACNVRIPEGAAPTCSDGKQNGVESDIDCGTTSGGSGCELCGEGLGCTMSSNCLGDLVCQNQTSVCVEPV